MKSFGISMLLVAVLGVLAGCGGGEDDSTISKEEFIAQANEICREAQEASDAEFEQQVPDQPTNADIKAFWDESARAGVEDQVEQIRALGAPEGDQEEVDAILAAVESGIDETQQRLDAGEFGQGPDPFDEADRLSADYGLDDCAN